MRPFAASFKNPPLSIDELIKALAAVTRSFDPDENALTLLLKEELAVSKDSTADESAIAPESRLLLLVASSPAALTTAADMALAAASSEDVAPPDAPVPTPLVCSKSVGIPTRVFLNVSSDVRFNCFSFRSTSSIAGPAPSIP